jgi:hypothetical protein
MWVDLEGMMLGERSQTCTAGLRREVGWWVPEAGVGRELVLNGDRASVLETDVGDSCTAMRVCSIHSILH